MKKKIFFAVLFFLKINFSGSQNIYDLEHSKKFAAYLQHTEQYMFAIEEYERILFMQPENDSVKNSIILNYLKANEIEKGILQTKKMYSDAYKMPYISAKNYLKLLTMAKKNNDADEFIKKNMLITENECLLMNFSNSMLSYNFQNAKKIYQKSDSFKSEILVPFKDLLNESLKIKFKNKTIAGVLSAIIPGSGKFYTEDKKNGFMSFVFVSTLAYQAISGFSKKKENSIYGWIFGTVGFCFYTGNIYGSAKSAQRYNERKKKNIIAKFQNIYNNIN